SCLFYTDTALAALANVSHILLYAPSVASFAALSQRKILQDSESLLKIVSVSHAKTSSAL
uniref:hypothetical protein n=1 Tax=Citrobacter farmeri TaxID=67824 RepID=UPI0021AC0018